MGNEKEALINQTDCTGQIKAGGLGSLTGFGNCDIIRGDTLFWPSLFQKSCDCTYE